MAMQVFATHYTTPDSERPSHEDSEYKVLFNGTQKFANLDFREVCMHCTWAATTAKHIIASTPYFYGQTIWLALLLNT